MSLAGISLQPVALRSATPTLAEIAQLANQGQFELATKKALDYAKAHPSSPESYALSALCSKPNNLLQAWDLASRGVAKFPENTVLRLLTVLACMEAGMLHERQSDIEDIIATDLDLEHPLVQICNELACGNNPTVSLDITLQEQRFTWVIERKLATIQFANEFYHWLPTFHNSVSNVDRFYENCEKYAKYNDGRNTRQQTYFVERLNLRGGEKVLDAGCGTGTLLAALSASAKIEATGVDISPKAGPHFLKRLPAATFHAGDLATLPFENATFDVVVSTDTLEHCSKPHKVVAELVRVTKPGGKLMISVPDGRFDSYIGHINFFSSQSLTSLLEDFGTVSLDRTVDGLVAEVKL